jgi:hypothetical protein
MSQHAIGKYEYDIEGDVLDVFFGDKRSAWTIELTDNILISIDRLTGQPVSLTFLDYSVLVEPGPFGWLSFPLYGLDLLPFADRTLVVKVLTEAPVNHWLDLSSVQFLSSSPLPVAHVAFVPPDLEHLHPQAA